MNNVFYLPTCSCCGRTSSVFVCPTCWTFLSVSKRHYRAFQALLSFLDDDARTSYIKRYEASTCIQTTNAILDEIWKLLSSDPQKQQTILIIRHDFHRMILLS